MTSDSAFNNPEVFQQPQPPHNPRFPNIGSEAFGGDKSSKDIQNDKDLSNELDWIVYDAFYTTMSCSCAAMWVNRRKCSKIMTHAASRKTLRMAKQKRNQVD